MDLNNSGSWIYLGYLAITSPYPYNLLYFDPTAADFGLIGFDILSFCKFKIWIYKYWAQNLIINQEWTVYIMIIVII